MKTLVQSIVVGMIALTLADDAFAGHPRRAEVNQRVRNQRKRIREGVKNGTMTQEEAQNARQNLRDIKKEEHEEVKANGGHLTKEQTKDLNQKLNENSQQIHEDKKE